MKKLLIIFSFIALPLLVANCQYFLQSFEQNTLKPLYLTHGIGNINGVVRVVQNPYKNSLNSSNYVLETVTPKSYYNFLDTIYTRAEYRETTKLPTVKYKHTYQWLTYLDSSIIKIDSIKYNNWMLLCQILTYPCNESSTIYPFMLDSICYGGGVFNEFRIYGGSQDTIYSNYRAYPDCDHIGFKYPIGEWFRITYEIYWDTLSDGWYNLWINNDLISHKSNVRTLMGGYVEDSCGVVLSIGQYNSWTDPDIDSLRIYIDDVNIYLDTDISLIMNQKNKVCLYK